MTGEDVYAQYFYKFFIKGEDEEMIEYIYSKIETNLGLQKDFEEVLKHLEMRVKRLSSITRGIVRNPKKLPKNEAQINAARAATRRAEETHCKERFCKQKNEADKFATKPQFL